MLNSRKKGRPVLLGLAAVLALLGLAGVALAFRLNDLMNPGFTAFLIGAFLYQFIANFVNTRS
jgi:small-conductance mechanosensitive channel